MRAPYSYGIEVTSGKFCAEFELSATWNWTPTGMGDPGGYSQLFKQIVADVWHKYGPFAALLILFAAFYEWRFTGLWKARLADKDKEIERLVKERDRLQDVILKTRLSSKKDNA